MNGNVFVTCDILSGSTSYKLTFDTPNFEVPAGSHNIYLAFSGTWTDGVWYKESEDIILNIIN